ncbi:MAG: TolC family protein [Planctomycetota bacterium]|jgi:outer membrane protein TolC
MLLVCAALLGLAGCKSPGEYRMQADETAYEAIRQKQQEAIGSAEDFTIERPSDILRRRLLKRQDLLYSSEASLGTDRLELIEHWPEDEHPQTGPSGDAHITLDPNEALKLSLIDALQVGAHNSFDYQSLKEDVFRAALDLDLERNEFRNIFFAQLQNVLSSDTSGDSTVTGVENSATAGVSRMLKSGADLSTAIAVDLVNLLTQGGASARGLAADATVSIPLLRGSGRHIVTEPLTQAERDVVYAIWQFERFKRTFAVDVARDYFSVLRQIDSVSNAEDNYRSAIQSARWSRRQADAGRITEVDVDRAKQRELEARNGWISSQAQYENNLDAFKRSIGLPPDARLELDPNELEKLRDRTSDIVEAGVVEMEAQAEKETPPADAPVELVPASDKDAGPFEIEESVAMELALENRLDLRVVIGGVYDAQRQVVVRADALRAELTLLGTADLGSRRSVGSATADNANLRFDEGRYASLLTLDLPVERTAERNAYRKSWIDLERATRSVQSLEDQIKLSIRNQLRSLLESRESLKIQAQSVMVAEKRVRMSTVVLEAGRIQILDLLDAQDDLLSAQNRLTAAVINYRTAELDLQKDMGLLRVDANGLWREFSPEVINNGKQ